MKASSSATRLHWTIFNANCSCHIDRAQTPRLVEGTTYSQIYCVRTAVACPTARQAVLPGDPDHSGLYLRIAGSGCYDRMPLGGPYLSAAEIMLVREWILAGARP